MPDTSVMLVIGVVMVGVATAASVQRLWQWDPSTLNGVTGQPPSGPPPVSNWTTNPTRK